ncbi:lysophospholipid acyltransferase family protein [Corynebacterium sp. 335C]
MANADAWKTLHGFRVPAGYSEPEKTDEAKEWFYGGLILRVARWYMRFQGLDITVEGSENMPVDGGAMVAVNHTGYFDFVYGGIPAYLNGRRLVRFMAKKEIFDHPVAGPLMRKMKHIPVDRAAGRGAYEESVRRLRGGALVGIFPEATISRSFEVKELKTGTARMARDAGVPIIPVTIFGSQRVWTKGRDKNLGRVKAPIWIRVGEPIQPGDDANESTARLHAAMEEQLDALKADYLERYGAEDGAWWVPAELGGSAPTLEVANEMDARDKEEREARRAARGSGSGSGTAEGSGGSGGDGAAGGA